MSQIFSKVELLTLSACDTATGGERQGKEVEGFAVLAQRQGAQAIVASLWPVYDTSTSQLMQHIYRLRDEHPLMSKAEEMFQSGKAPYPVERTLLTSGVLAAAMLSLATDQKRIETPHLRVRYDAPRASQFWQK